MIRRRHPDSPAAVDGSCRIGVRNEGVDGTREARDAPPRPWHRHWEQVLGALHRTPYLHFYAGPFEQASPARGRRSPLPQVMWPEVPKHSPLISLRLCLTPLMNGKKVGPCPRQKLPMRAGYLQL